MEASFEVGLATPSQVDGLWSQVADGLRIGADRCGGDISTHYMWEECRAGRCFLVVVSFEGTVFGASVWRFEPWGNKTVFRCLAWYGRELDKWLADHRAVSERMARAGHADKIVAEGRRGLQAIFPEAKILRYLYEVDLNV